VSNSTLKFINIPLVNLVQECATYYHLIQDDQFCAQFKSAKADVPIVAPYIRWYGLPGDLLTMILQRQILGIESYISGIVVMEVVRKNLVTPDITKKLKDPFSFGGRGTADNYYNRLPAVLDPNNSLRQSNPDLWQETRQFYKDVRNPLFHGKHIFNDDPKALLPPLELLKQLYAWIESWFDGSVWGHPRITNRWTGATGSDFRIKPDPAKLLGSAVARSTPPFARIACVSTESGSDPIKTKLACRSRRYRSEY